MSSDIGEFPQWLNGKLRELNTDESIFGSYINGILEGDETIEEKREALEGILSAIIVSTQCVFIWVNFLIKGPPRIEIASVFTVRLSLT